MTMRSNLLVCFILSLMLIPSLKAQAVPTALRSSTIQAGAGYLILSPDYTEVNIKGVSFWADYDFKRWIGVEFSGHLGDIITPGDVSEDSYFIGPRLLYHRHRLAAYGKALIGRGTLASTHNGSSLTTASYNAFAFGGGVEYRLTRKINLRPIDIEIQKWPSFYPNSLSPIAYTFGASYIIK